MNKMMMNLAMLLLFSILTAGIADAHVVVYPQEATQGTYEKFTVRVPTEKDIPTVKVEVRFAADAVMVSRLEPKPGWTYSLTKDASNKITGVTWTSTGEGLSSTEFGDFNMLAKVADNAGQIVWKAYQTYKDGSVVEWVGAADSDKPASITVVKPKPASTATDSHGNTNVKDAAGQEGAAAGSSNAPLYLSIAAVALSAASLLVSLLRRRA